MNKRVPVDQCCSLLIIVCNASEDLCHIWALFLRQLNEMYSAEVENHPDTRASVLENLTYSTLST